MLSHIMRSLFLLSLLHQMFVTAKFYTINCMQSVTVQCGEPAIVMCNHTDQLDLVIIGWTNSTRKNHTLNIINGTPLNEDEVSVEATQSELKLTIHNVSVSDVLNFIASSENGNNNSQITLHVVGVCGSKHHGNGTDLVNNKTFDSNDTNTLQSSAQKPERSKFVAVSVLGILAVLLVLAILVYKKRVWRWKNPKSRGRLFSQSSLMRDTEEESYLENPPADTT